MLAIALLLRSSCQTALQCITNFGSGALTADTTAAPRLVHGIPALRARLPARPAARKAEERRGAGDRMIAFCPDIVDQAAAEIRLQSRPAQIQMLARHLAESGSFFFGGTG